MEQGTRKPALQGLLAALGSLTLLLGAFRILRPLEALLALVCLGLIRQVTRKAPEAPAADNEKFWMLFNGTSDAVFIRDDSRFMGAAPFLEANDMACRRLGYTLEELRKLAPRDIALPEDEARLQAVNEALQAQGHAIFECAVRTKGGEVYPVEVHVHHMRLGGRTVILSMLRDITARKRTEEVMRHLSQAVAQSPVAIVITDTQGRITFVNRRAQETTGYTEAELLGRNPRILNSGFNPPEIFRELWAAITAGQVWDGDLQNKRKTGELFWGHATISPILDDAGAITHFMSFMEDITGEKQLREQLRHAQKLEAVGQLAGGVAHDFNNILQVINGYGTLIQMTLPEGDSNRSAVGEIMKAAERAAHLTHSLLAFSRKQIMNPKNVDLNAVVTNVDKFLRRVIGEDIQLKLQRSEEPLPVKVDVGQIEQVLMNLATNARDAMPAGGVLTVATSFVETDHQFEQSHGFGRAGRYALITVTDNGCGMDEATQKRIFDPFFSTKEMGRGTGLGLSIVYGIVKQHGGYVVAASELKVGTTFRIYLPLVPEPADGEGEPLAVQPQVKGTETILVAEDEAGVRGMVEMVLRKYGYRVLLAADGREAVAQFQAHRDEIQLILMDIIMPHLGGRQAFEEIQALDPQVKVLFTSGYTADFIKSRGDLGQGMELVMKPVQPLELLRRIRGMLDRTLPAPVE